MFIVVYFKYVYTGVNHRIAKTVENCYVINHSGVLIKDIIIASHNESALRLYIDINFLLQVKSIIVVMSIMLSQ